jgi:MFS family permease
VTAQTAPLARLRGLPLWQPLASRDFKLLWSGETVSLIGDQFHYVALAWLVLDLTGSGLALGSILLASSIPRAIALLVGGALSDRLPARTLLLGSNLGRMVLTGAIGVLVMAGGAELWHLAVIGVLFGLIDAVHMPAFRSLVPRAVEERAIAPATSLIESTIQLAGLIGPPIAGVVVATWGIAVAFGIDALTFLVAAVSVVFLTVGRTPAISAAANGDGAPASREGVLDSIRSGLAYAFGIGPVRTLIAVSLVLNLSFNGPIAVGLPWLADRVLDAGSTGFGVMLAAFGAGAVAGSVLCGAIGGRFGSPTLMVLLVGTLGAMLGVIGLAPSLPVVVAVLAVMGAGVGYTNVLVISWFQRRTDPAMLGRLMSIVFLASSVSSPFSFALSGVLADTIGTGLFLAAAALVLVTVALVAVTRSMPDFGEPEAATAGV